MAAEARGIRARTTIAASAILGLALTIGGIALVVLVQRTLIRNVDEVAEARAEDIAALVADGTVPSTLAVEEDSAAQVVDPSGRVVAASANVRGRPPFAELTPSAEEAVTRTAEDLPGVPGRFRIVALAARGPDGPATVLVATGLDAADEALFVLRTSLLAGIPLLIALGAALAWITVGRALQPVEAIRAQVADVSGAELHRRVPVPNARDEIARLAVTMNAMLERLEDSATRQRRFVADASHELQTPLAAARTDLEVALAHPGAAPWEETARALLEGNRQMERLVADLLFVARADEGRAETPRTPVDLHDVVLDEAARLGDPIDTEGVEPAVVRGRREDLARAARNLLDNAVRHATSAVWVRVKDTDSEATLVVEDDGPGVPPADRERIFERFTRLDDARTRGAGGTGLGLAIVREIVHRHDGSVAVEDRPGGGARFVVRFPSA